MLTTDPIYYKPLLPVITIKNTANNTTLYTYNSFTDTGTTDKVLHSSVNLSQNTHGEFVVQFEDQNKSLESTVTVGSRVQIDCGKQSSSLTRLISGLVRKKGYARGANNKVLYTISGTSTGIRLNERLTYTVSEAARLATGQIDFNDTSRQADKLLASGLNILTADGILSIANLAANSDVETFIASTNIQYGELQDLVNYYEDQSGGEVVVDTSDLVHFRHEIKNNLFGRGFTIMNSNTNRANHDADDTIYLVNKNWSYEDDFYKSSNYGNRFYALLASESDTTDTQNNFTLLPPNISNTNQIKETAVKFRPTHSHFLPGDIYLGWRHHIGRPAGGIGLDTIDLTYDANEATVINQTRNAVNANSFATDQAMPYIWRIVGPDVSNTPNSLSVSVNILQMPDGFTYPVGTTSYSKITNSQVFFDPTGQTLEFFDLDITKNYWLLLSDDNSTIPDGSTTKGHWAQWQSRTNTFGTTIASANAGASSNSSAGSGWSVTSNDYAFWYEMPRKRSHSFVMYDPKAMTAVSSGLSVGLATDTLLTDAPVQVTTFDSMYRFIQQQTYNLVRPRTVYSFPTVTAPNIPPFPGDPIIISDDILGFSTAGNQVVLTTCGDMSYRWGNMGSGNYEAPTNLSINAIGVPSRYR